MTLFYRKIFVLFFTFGAVLGGQGQEKSAPLGGAAYQEKYQHRIRRTPIPIKIDGELSDEAWQTATASKNFAPHWPQDNVPLKRDTEVKMAVDDRFFARSRRRWRGDRSRRSFSSSGVFEENVILGRSEAQTRESRGEKALIGASSGLRCSGRARA